MMYHQRSTPDHFSIFVNKWMDDAAREAANELHAIENQEQRERQVGLAFFLCYAAAVVIFALMIAAFFKS